MGDRDAPFLTARWQSLLLLNYKCPRELLDPLVPTGTELDDWRGDTMVSLVGFRFVDTRVAGVGFPCHRTFEEVNLRFYVRRPTTLGEPRRGVVFIRELVPRRAIAAVARYLYDEPYRTVPMDHEVTLDPGSGGVVRYSWRHRGHEHSVRAEVSGAARALTAGSEAEFITEHYWGYTRQRRGGTLEYEVDHLPWRIWDAPDARYESPADTSLHGPEFTEVLRGRPKSAFVADGGEVSVFPGIHIVIT